MNCVHNNIIVVIIIVLIINVVIITVLIINNDNYYYLTNIVNCKNMVTDNNLTRFDNNLTIVRNWGLTII